MELALSILAILLSIPAIFLSVYVLVRLLRFEFQKQLEEQALNSPTRPPARDLEELEDITADDGPGMYDIDEEPESVDDFGL